MKHFKGYLVKWIKSLNKSRYGVFFTEKYVTKYITFISVLANAKQKVGVCLHSLNTDLGSQGISKYIEALVPRCREDERTQTVGCTRQPTTVSRAQELVTLTQYVGFNPTEHTSLSKFPKREKWQVRILLTIKVIVLEPYTLKFLSSAFNKQQLT